MTPLPFIWGGCSRDSKPHSRIQSELPFAQKVWDYVPHRAMWRCCPSLLLKEHVSQQTCCLSILRTTLTSEAEMSFRCFSLQFTCRARGRRCIPFWVTHTSTELSTKGQTAEINSSLTWTYTKPLSTFFTLTTVQQWPRLAREVVQSLSLEVCQDPTEQSPAQPGLISEPTLLEAGSWTTDLLTTHQACIFL